MFLPKQGPCHKQTSITGLPCSRTDHIPETSPDYDISMSHTSLAIPARREAPAARGPCQVRPVSPSSTQRCSQTHSIQAAMWNLLSALTQRQALQKTHGQVERPWGSCCRQAPDWSAGTPSIVQDLWHCMEAGHVRRKPEAQSLDLDLTVPKIGRYLELGFYPGVSPQTYFGSVELYFRSVLCDIAHQWSQGRESSNGASVKNDSFVDCPDWLRTPFVQSAKRLN
ncbi:hypothetical protein UY3_08691 [Chelonia mydas]|uniref:Uncharacterized protein n=1 Tax=Chelonia mydas TaxID=8469 RepID=M7B890_CHEMY|nr:hypothetical protein UY3_08691 [Chelonia mydas]